MPKKILLRQLKDMLDASQATLQFTSVINDTTITLCTAETYAMTTELTTVNVDCQGQVLTG